MKNCTSSRQRCARSCPGGWANERGVLKLEEENYTRRGKGTRRCTHNVPKRLPGRKMPSEVMMDERRVRMFCSGWTWTWPTWPGGRAAETGLVNVGAPGQLQRGSSLRRRLVPRPTVGTWPIGGRGRGPRDGLGNRFDAIYDRLHPGTVCLLVSEADSFTMTTYIPSLTLPSFIFQNAPVSILLPIISGSAVGFAISRELFIDQVDVSNLMRCSATNTECLQQVEATPAASPGLCLWPSVDGPLCHHGLHGLPCIHDRILLDQS